VDLRPRPLSTVRHHRPSARPPACRAMTLLFILAVASFGSSALSLQHDFDVMPSAARLLRLRQITSPRLFSWCRWCCSAVLIASPILSRGSADSGNRQCRVECDDRTNKREGRIRS